MDISTVWSLYSVLKDKYKNESGNPHELVDFAN